MTDEYCNFSELWILAQATRAVCSSKGGCGDKFNLASREPFHLGMTLHSIILRYPSFPCSLLCVQVFKYKAHFWSVLMYDALFFRDGTSRMKIILLLTRGAIVVYTVFVMMWKSTGSPYSSYRVDSWSVNNTISLLSNKTIIRRCLRIS
jgi:hypothetical protein